MRHRQVHQRPFKSMILKRTYAALLGRCPHCLKGAIFASLITMHDDCPVCGIHYERETGYFMMAIFFGYFLCGAICLPLCIWLYRMQAPILWYIASMSLALGLTAPWIFRYGRIIWLHIDELLDPRSEPTA